MSMSLCSLHWFRYCEIDGLCEVDLCSRVEKKLEFTRKMFGMRRKEKEKASDDRGHSHSDYPNEQEANAWHELPKFQNEVFA